MSNRTTRRSFIRHTAVAGAALPAVMPALVRAQSANDTPNVAFIAVGGRAGAHVGFSKKAGLNCVAFAEVDKNRWGGVMNHDAWKNDAKGYTDWRKVFENHAKDTDLMFVATPDHSHFAPTMTAISMGIHCYTEKPLAWSVRENQLLAQAYEKNPKVVTQMGNQGHAGEGWRVAYEMVKAGAIGKIVEFHTWTNRPVWPQDGGPRPPKDWEKPAPDNLDWEAWIGPAPMRPYAEAPGKGRKGPYHPFAWRGRVDFGSGALGDMACHTTDGIYSIMNPGYAETGEPIFQTGPVRDEWQKGMIFKMTFRAKGDQPAFTTYWYEGYKNDGSPVMPDKPEELGDRDMPRTGNIIVGTEGKMLVTGDYWNSPRLIPEKKHQEFAKSGAYKKLLERSPGHHEEFLMAAKGEKPRAFSRSNFGYAGPMTANIQLGNLCARAGKKLVLDENGKVVNDPSINELAWREPRDGWGPLEMKV